MISLANFASSPMWIALGVAITILVILYVIYKLSWARDYGVPIRRHVFRMGMFVERDQVAHVPIWWSDIMIQHRLDRYWKESLRSNFNPNSPEL